MPVAVESRRKKLASELGIGIPPCWKNGLKFAQSVEGLWQGLKVFERGDAVRLNFRDWYEMVNPQVATFSELANVAHT